MRYRMLQIPEVAESLNRETVPVVVNVSNREFPDIPALAPWRSNHRVNPWAHMIYAVFVLMDADGERIYGSSTCQFVEIAGLRDPFRGADVDLARFLDRARRARDLKARAAGDAVARAELALLDAEVGVELARRRECVEDLRPMTCRFLLGYGAAPWPRILESVMPPAPGADDTLEPGVRQAVIHALGSVVANDAPFAPCLREHLRIIYENRPAERDALTPEQRARLDGSVESDQPIDIPLPASLKIQAAVALGRLLGQTWDVKPNDFLAHVQAWWRENRDDSRWAIPGVETSRAGPSGQDDDPAAARDASGKAAATAACAAPSCAAEHDDGVDWQPDFETAMAKAKREGKPILLAFNVNLMARADDPTY